VAEDGTILSADRLSKRFGGLVAVNSASLRVREGSFHAIIGPNGAGKTTLFNLLSGVLLPDGGKVWFGGRDVTRLAPHRRARLGIARTFQIVSLFAELTVLENVLVAVLARRGHIVNLLRPYTAYGEAWAEAASVLKGLDIQRFADWPVTSLSYGDRKFVEIAMAFALRPRLLLLDEPTAGMGLHERSAAMRTIRHVAAQEKVTVLFTEHDMDVVFDYADVITVMHQGRVIAEGPPEEISQRPDVQEIYLGADRDKGGEKAPEGKSRP
jgi:branched-chain amino acid transport system ATP-binding protein